MTNLQELKRLALAATKFKVKSTIELYEIKCGKCEEEAECGDSELCCEEDVCHNCCAEYFHIMRPSKILSLISDLETCIEALEWYGQEFKGSLGEPSYGHKAREALSKIKERI